MKFKEWFGNKVYVLVGGEVSGTSGAAASLHVAALDGNGGYRKGRLGGPSSTFLDPGTLVRNVEFKGVGENLEKIYHLEASFNQGKSWSQYETHERPILKDPETGSEQE